MKEDKPPNKGQAKGTLLRYRKSPLKEDNLSTKDKTAGLEGVLLKSALYTHSPTPLSVQLYIHYRNSKQLVLAPDPLTSSMASWTKDMSLY